MKKQIATLLVVLLFFGWYGTADAEIAAEEWISRYEESTGVLKLAYEQYINELGGVCQSKGIDCH